LIMPGDEMQSRSVLDHLLKVEAEAAALVSDAQNEADRRIRDNEEKNRALCEERLKEQIHIHELSFKEEKENIDRRYNEALDKFREELKNVNADESCFRALLNGYLGQTGLNPVRAQI